MEPRSKQFYGETLGLPSQIGEQGFPEFQLGENVSLYLLDMETDRRRTFTGAAHRVDSRCACADVAAGAAELEAKGVEFEGDTFDTGVCHMAFFRDPDGNALMLHRRTRRC